MTSSGDKAVFTYAGIPELLNSEGKWRFNLEFRWSHGRTNLSDPILGPTPTVQYLKVVFTIEKKGQQPDLTANSTERSCNKIPAKAWKVQDVTPIPAGQDPEPVTSCANLSPAQTPNPSPCQANIASDVASSISSVIMQTACWESHPVISCPPDSDSRADHSNHLGRSIVGVVVAGWILMLSY